MPGHHFAYSACTAAIDWIERHPATIDLIKWFVLILIAWVGGIFSYFRRFVAHPYLRIQDTASLVFIEHPEESIEEHIPHDAVRASFIIDASLINSSNERIVLDTFELGYEAINSKVSYKQRLIRYAFPAHPQKQIGAGMKPMPVWFTQYANDDTGVEPSFGDLEPKEMASGYLLFTSFTFGGWNPIIKNNSIRVLLTATLTSGKTLRVWTRLAIDEDEKRVNEFCPRLSEHLKHWSTWVNRFPPKEHFWNRLFNWFMNKFGFLPKV